MYKANVNCGVLKEHIDFLIKQGLFEERIIRRERVVYAITHRGVIVLKQFKELKEVLPIVEETKTKHPICSNAPILYHTQLRKPSIKRTVPSSSKPTTVFQISTPLQRKVCLVLYYHQNI